MATKKQSASKKETVPAPKEVSKAQETIEKAENSKDSPMNKIASKKTTLPEGMKESDIRVGANVVINSERYKVLEGKKLKHVITGKEISY